MVGEFPELQGLIGGYYAAAQGEDPAVAAAIRDHYKPVGQGDEVPTAPVTVAVSLADKLDTIVSFFSVYELPSGSKDPFALRRSSLGTIATSTTNNLRYALSDICRFVFDLLTANPATKPHLLSAGRMVGRSLEYAGDDEGRLLDHSFWLASTQLQAFFADRLKVQQREAGVRHDLIDAVFALGGEDDLVRLLARVRALQAFVGTEDGSNLLAGYKRAANILKKEGFAAAAAVIPAEAGIHSRSADDGVATAAAMDSRLRGNDEGIEGTAPGQRLPYAPDPAETALIAALDAAEPAAAQAVAAEDFEAAMTALATLRVPIDAFFDSVTVNDPDPDKRAARLALLGRVRAAVHAVADFSKIEG